MPREEEAEDREEVAAVAEAPAGVAAVVVAPAEVVAVVVALEDSGAEVEAEDRLTVRKASWAEVCVAVLVAPAGLEAAVAAKDRLMVKGALRAEACAAVAVAAEAPEDSGAEVEAEDQAVVRVVSPVGGECVEDRDAVVVVVSRAEDRDAVSAVVAKNSFLSNLVLLRAVRQNRVILSNRFYY